jgi:transcriptional regulator with XRE-family HTH domain
MEFSELLNYYMTLLNCTAKELSEYSNLSPQVISRYRSGNRKPAKESPQLIALADGFFQIAQEKGEHRIASEELIEEFKQALSSSIPNIEDFSKKFNLLLETVNVNMKNLSSFLHLDLSFLYKIRQGQRKPYNINDFSALISKYIAQHHASASEKEKLAALFACDVSLIQTAGSYEANILSFLTLSSVAVPTESFDDISGFVKKMDEFNLDEFIRAIHFDELKVPKIPFFIPTDKIYPGVEEMRKGELDFFKSTVLSKSMEPIFMYNEMPMADTAEDMEFNKKWMFAIAMSIKKGLHMNVIHNLDRPFNELMLGLEAWLPIYMTGQISPYYLPDGPDKLYRHMDYVSGAVALTGECISGHHNDGKYELISNKSALSYYKRKAELLLSKALPLMDIYDESRKQDFHLFEEHNSVEKGTRHNILSSLPIYTISEELLTKICARSAISETDTFNIKEDFARQKKWILNHLHNGSVLDEIMIPSKEEFARYPMALDLGDCYFHSPLIYTYEEMLEHLELTKAFAASNGSYTLQLSDVTAFRNMQLRILEGKYAVMSKIKTPAIHFVIKHPALVNALQHFKIAVIEQK